MRGRLAAALPHESLPGWAPCLGCLGRVQHRVGIYLNKEAKASFSGQNRASRGRSGVWAATLGSNRGIGLPGTQSLWSPWI